ncbi:MAG: LacI family DNA-binding transcriptional regulator [Anaerolineaceae bacterium]|nr:LacI family DNA-binding transcriptional regulator [Anaerolineaceae bacterium]
MKRATLQDIADKAGVGAGTVSRVLNNHPYVKEETRLRVLDAMRELDYYPSFSARHMRTQRSRLIGFLTDEVATSPFAGEIIRGAQDAVWDQDYILLVIDMGDNPARAEKAIKTLVEREVEGIIYAAMYHQPVTLPESITQVPTVLANCYAEDRSLASVVPNEFQGGYEATQRLLDAGHQRVAYINIHPTEPGTAASKGRLAGYQQALADYNLPYDEILVSKGSGHADSGYRFGYELMHLSNPPTAIFCGTDRTAMGAYDALKEQGLRIPEDVAIVGFDNQNSIAEALRPGLSTMQLPHYEMGRWAITYLIEQLESDSPMMTPIQHQLPCPYIERDSVK